MILVLDNYDSFTYNLVHLLYTLNAQVEVRRNREITVDEAIGMNPDAILLSPGPGRPENAGVMPQLIKAVRDRIPLLGVCLGHQAIGQVFGGRVVHAGKLMHGKASQVSHDGKGIFEGIPQNFKAMRYHSLAVDAGTLPDCLQITARSDDGEIMAMRHREFPIVSVQYHPESIVTATGKRQLANFLKMLHGEIKC